MRRVLLQSAAFVRARTSLLKHLRKHGGVLERWSRTFAVDQPPNRPDRSRAASYRVEVSALPTVTGIPGPYRFFFYSFDCNEPRHVHVRRDRAVCKFWLEPVVLAYNNGFSAKELNRIRKIILDNLDRIREARDEHCGQ